MTGNEARKLFLEYFKKHDHRVVRSSSLIPHDDPTLLFVNAGMVQFKRTFIGEEKRDYVTAATSQKCVRAGGKHNDLENVGYTARHHTFFEMLGNFSFGDYFKEKAIEFAWDLLLNGYNLPKEKLWISVFLDDDEAYDIWHKNMGVSEDRIVRLGEKDNFWSMGDTGPCGPCSEIHMDRGEKFGCKKSDCKVGCDCDRFLEIWNLVFMEFNRDASGTMTPLPKPSIDTGMGLERIVSVIQDVPTNYETDLFVPIIKTVENLSKKKLGDSSKDDVAMKVIADHSRASAFLIGDGILPSNEGRGYVLRRIMRRAIRYGRNMGLTRPFLHETVKTVLDVMKQAYPDLSENSAFIINVVENEEKHFSKTLDKGLKLLDDNLNEIKEKGLSVIPGDVIFKLYDTFGFPVDIVEDVIKDENISLDMDGFNKLMKIQQEQSGTTISFSNVCDAYKKLSEKGEKTQFVGYENLQHKSTVLVLVEKDKEIDVAEKGSKVEVVTQETPFYGESGGQTGDKGKITGDGFKLVVENTLKDPTGLFIHICKVISGTINKGAKVILEVDQERRKATALNHTATHLLHTALGNLLGDHVKQAGSLVSPERLRFDFTHFSAVDRQTMENVERNVNDKIRKNIKVQYEELDADQAFKTGAKALFDEKYGDIVRVVSMDSFSSEFCGGTHTDRTGDIGLFRILSQSSIAAGVRRIEAVTGSAAVKLTQAEGKVIQDTSGLLREKPETLTKRVEKLLSELKSLEKEVDRLKSKIASRSADEAEDDYKTVKNIKVLSKKVPIDNPGALRDLADKFKDRIKSGIVVLGAVAEEKALLIVVVTKDLNKDYHAGKIVKELAKEVGGSGGGRPDMAQAGGTKPENIEKALNKIFEIIEG